MAGAESPDSDAVSGVLSRQISLEGLSPDGRKKDKEKKKKKKKKERDAEEPDERIEQVLAPPPPVAPEETQPPPREAPTSLEVTGDLDEEDYELLASGEPYMNSREEIIEALQRRRRLREQAGIEPPKGPSPPPSFAPHDYHENPAPPERPALIPHHDEDHAPLEWPAPTNNVQQNERPASLPRDDVYDIMQEAPHVPSTHYDSYQSASPAYEYKVENSAPPSSILRTSFVGSLPQAYNPPPSPHAQPAHSYVSGPTAYSGGGGYAPSEATVLSAYPTTDVGFMMPQSGGTLGGTISSFPGLPSMGGFGSGVIPAFSRMGMMSMPGTLGGSMGGTLGGTMGGMTTPSAMGMVTGMPGMRSPGMMGMGVGMGMGMMRPPMPFMGPLSLMQPMVAAPMVVLMRKRDLRDRRIPHMHLNIDDLRDAMY